MTPSEYPEVSPHRLKGRGQVKAGSVEDGLEERGREEYPRDGVRLQVLAQQRRVVDNGVGQWVHWDTWTK